MITALITVSRWCMFVVSQSQHWTLESLPSVLMSSRVHVTTTSCSRCARQCFHGNVQQRLRVRVCLHSIKWSVHTQNTTFPCTAINHRFSLKQAHHVSTTEFSVQRTHLSLRRLCHLLVYCSANYFNFYVFTAASRVTRMHPESVNPRRPPY